VKTNGYRIAKDAPLPNPAYTPEEVIQLILDALRHNDQPYADAGIERAMSFSAPSFRPFPGPSEGFFQMVKNSIYGALINFQRAEFDPIQIAGDRAEQRITITAADGQQAIFVWILAKQSKPPYTDCWMTDGVLRQEDANG